jgi:hypothetical protein
MVAPWVRGGGVGAPTLAQQIFGSTRQGALYMLCRPNVAFTDDSLTLPATWGDQVQTVRDLSHNGLNGVAAVGERPIKARTVKPGRLNLLRPSEDLNDSRWTKTAITPAQVAGAEWSITETTANSLHRLKMQDSTLPTDQGMGHVAIEIRAGLRRRWNINMRRADSNVAHTDSLLVDLLSGTVINNTTGEAPIFDDLGGGWFRIGMFRPPSTGTNVLNLIGASDTATDATDDAQHIYAGDNSAPAAFVRRPQMGIGSTRHPYQRIGNLYDISQEGEPEIRYLAHPGSQQVKVTLPDLGTAATVIWADTTEVTVVENQTIGAGAYNLPTPAQLVAFMVTDEPLSAASIALVEGAFEECAQLF